MNAFYNHTPKPPLFINKDLNLNLHTNRNDIMTSTTQPATTYTLNEALIANQNAAQADPYPDSDHRFKVSVPLSAKRKNKIVTEDLGKMFEMAICLAFQIDYIGNYKYGMELPISLQPRLAKLIELFPNCRHTAQKGARYDYTSLTDEHIHLSAKTTKKLAKIAPQVVGQASPYNFSQLIGIEYTSVNHLKEYIQREIHNLLPILVGHTFDCPTIYYNQHTNTIRFIVLQNAIDWTGIQFKWTRAPDKWVGSSTLKILLNGAETSLLEWQFHSKDRTNMAVRWNFENFLRIFKQNISIVDL